MNNDLGYISKFEKYLSYSCLIPPKKIKFYVYWVSRFLNYSKHRASKSLDQIVASYLDAMEKYPRFADWQIKKAANAILLFSEKYLNKDRIAIPISIGSSTGMRHNGLRNGQNKHIWINILVRFHKNMRLRHYSPRTEKSYRIWINKFRQYVNNSDPHALEGKEVKKFLTHLALRERISASTQNQAFNALLFLFRNVLQKELTALPAHWISCDSF